MREFGYDHPGELEVIDENVRYTEFMVMQAIDTLDPKTIDKVRLISNFTGRLDLAPRWQLKFRKVASTASQVGEEEEDEQDEYEEKLERRSIKPIHAFLRGVTFGYPMLISRDCSRNP
ncbi:hypothetical protein L486_07474 [Kwoniella mangroviensis CBS 10435]|uniref:Uncharacterized protein n=1 Tax=Kwoniella mangroviensis CBS 10435 TaxID=1331196 RepID=A0A1B9IGK6_9TREE|nr:hypothetical protein L486_07474 [Kwoniella mangroviensis CBS 10435]